MPRASQTGGTMSFGEHQHAHAIHNDQRIHTEQAIGIQHLAADQGLSQTSHSFLQFCRIQPTESGVQRVAMRTGLGLEDRLELSAER